MPYINNTPHIIAGVGTEFVPSSSPNNSKPKDSVHQLTTSKPIWHHKAFWRLFEHGRHPICAVAAVKHT